MKKFPRIASLVLFAFLGLFYVAFGTLYASVDNLLWFHAAAVPAEAHEAVRPLYFALMKLIGGASIALGLLGLWATAAPLRRGVPLAGTALFLAYAIPLAMAAVVAEILAKATGSPTSWHIMGALMAVNVVALVAHAAGARPASG